MPSFDNFDSSALSNNLRVYCGMWKAKAELCVRLLPWNGPAVLIKCAVERNSTIQVSEEVCANLFGFAVRKLLSLSEPMPNFQNEVPLNFVPQYAPSAAALSAGADCELNDIGNSFLSESDGSVENTLLSTVARTGGKLAVPSAKAVQAMLQIRYPIFTGGKRTKGNIEEMTAPERKHRWILKNRESAARSNQRRKERDAKLKAELRSWKMKVPDLGEEHDKLSFENVNMHFGSKSKQTQFALCPGHR
jgi:hypothetical protein